MPATLEARFSGLLEQVDSITRESHSAVHHEILAVELDSFSLRLKLWLNEFCSAATPSKTRSRRTLDEISAQYTDLELDLTDAFEDLERMLTILRGLLQAETIEMAFSTVKEILESAYECIGALSQYADLIEARSAKGTIDSVTANTVEDRTVMASVTAHIIEEQAMLDGEFDIELSEYSSNPIVAAATQRRFTNKGERDKRISSSASMDREFNHSERNPQLLLQPYGVQGGLTGMSNAQYSNNFGLMLDRPRKSAVHLSLNRGFVARPNDSVAQRNFPCMLRPYGCMSSFTSKNEWKRHLETKHISTAVYLCKLCVDWETRPNIFNRKDLFSQHVERMHPNVQFYE